MVIDCRFPVTMNLKEWQKTLDQWCKEAGSDVWIEYEQKDPQVEVTKLDGTNPFWIAFENTSKEM